MEPLEGRTVVVTRAAAQAPELSTLLESYGAKVFVCPTIEIREPESYERLDEALDHLYGYDWLIFTSANGVEFFLRRLTDRGLKVADLDETKVCAIGQRTADRLHEAHVHVDLVPSQSTGEGVFAALIEFVGGSEQLQGLNIMLPRAAVGRDYLPKALEQAGARVDVVTAYQTVLPENFDRGRLSAMLAGSGDCIAFSSPSSIKNLARLFDTHDLGNALPGVVIACIGPVTAAAAVEHGLRVDIQPAQQTVKDLAQAIADYYTQSGVSLAGGGLAPLWPRQTLIDNKAAPGPPHSKEAPYLPVLHWRGCQRAACSSSIATTRAAQVCAIYSPRGATIQL